MDGEQTAEEQKAELIEKMGEDLGTYYAALWQHLVRLYLNWKEYVELFGTSPERIERLNNSASTFFRMLQDELFDVNLLHIARLIDPPETFGKANLTVRGLPPRIADEKFRA